MKSAVNQDNIVVCYSKILFSSLKFQTFYNVGMIKFSMIKIYVFDLHCVYLM